MYELDISKIKPKNVRKSDKYSCQIYKFLKEHPQYRRVYYNKNHYDIQTDTYIEKEFDVNDIRLDNLFFVFDKSSVDSGEFNGKKLRSLVGDSRDKYEIFYYVGDKFNLVDVTEEFFERYIEIGRCIYDDHRWLKDEDTRYTYMYDGTHRKCNWCGREQHKEVITRTYETKEWIDN